LSPRLAVLAPARRDGRSIPSDLLYDAYGYPGSMLIPTGRVAHAIAERARSLGTKKVLFGTPWPLVLLGPRLQAEGLEYAVIVHGAEMLVPSKVPLINKRLARALSGAEMLLPVSRFTGAATTRFLQRRGLRVPPIEILRARVDLERFHPDAASQAFGMNSELASRPLLLCFGRVVKRKGIDRAIEVLPRIAEAFPNVRLAVAGTGPELKRLRKLALRLGAPVTFLGRIPDEDAPSLYATADIFLLPVVDRYWGLEVEGLGVVLLEAAACETPSVTGRSGGTPEAVIDGETGFVVEAQDAHALANATMKLLNNEQLRAEMGMRARQHVERNFAADRIPRAFLDWLVA
jgi:phosphatidyl-myo-inositol dimannoside synthase